MKKYTALPKTAEEITGQSGCIRFGGKEWCYTETMNVAAKKGKQIQLISQDGCANAYDYYDYGSLEDKYSWKEEWLKDIREVEEKTWKVGNSIRAKQLNDIFNLVIISIGRGECILLVKGSYNRWNDPIKVSDTTGITRKELNLMLGSATLLEE